MPYLFLCGASMYPLSESVMGGNVTGDPFTVTFRSNARSVCSDALSGFQGCDQVTTLRTCDFLFKVDTTLRKVNRRTVVGLARGHGLPCLVAAKLRERDTVRRLERESVLCGENEHRREAKQEGGKYTDPDIFAFHFKKLLVISWC